MNEVKKTFEQLVAEKASCFEFAWHGFIRMYEEGEKRCDCKDCVATDKLKADIDAIYTRVPIDMPFDPQRQKSAIRLAQDAKFLENAQRSKNIQDREAAYGKEVYLNGPIVCKHCEKLPIECECVHA